MSTQVQQVPAEQMKKLVKLGKGFGFGNVLKQAKQTASAYSKYGEHLDGRGFDAQDAEKLKVAMGEMEAIKVKKKEGRLKTKKTSDGCNNGVKIWRVGRNKSRLVLGSLKEDAQNSLPSEESIAIVATINDGLSQTRNKPKDVAGMAEQFEFLCCLFRRPEIAALAKARKGEALADKLEKDGALLKRADEASVEIKDLPEQIEQVRLISGIIVRLVRRANRAADSAAKENGGSFLREAFALSALYGGERGRSTKTAIDGGVTSGTPIGGGVAPVTPIGEEAVS